MVCMSDVHLWRGTTCLHIESMLQCVLSLNVDYDANCCNVAKWMNAIWYDWHYSIYFFAALFTQFSSFKAKTGGPAKTTPAGKTTATTRSITGKAPGNISNKTTPAKKDDKKPSVPRKEGPFLCLFLLFVLLQHSDILWSMCVVVCVCVCFVCCKEDMTFIYSTHDPEMMQYAKRTIQLHDGAIHETV